MFARSDLWRTELVEHDLWVIDDDQDFNGSEDAVIRNLVADASGALMAGFALLATFDRPHLTLVLADLGELTLTRLNRCFDDPIPNPGRAPGR